MTLFDFIYGIGSGVAFIMGIIGLTIENNQLPTEERCFGGVAFGAFICAALSWAVPIWWIGFEVYKRMGKKK